VRARSIHRPFTGSEGQEIEITERASAVDQRSLLIGGRPFATAYPYTACIRTHQARRAQSEEELLTTLIQGRDPAPPE
jgi:hypothetical protein